MRSMQPRQEITGPVHTSWPSFPGQLARATPGEPQASIHTPVMFPDCIMQSRGAVNIIRPLTDAWTSARAGLLSKHFCGFHFSKSLQAHIWPKWNTHTHRLRHEKTIPANVLLLIEEYLPINSYVYVDRKIQTSHFYSACFDTFVDKSQFNHETSTDSLARSSLRID